MRISLVPRARTVATCAIAVAICAVTGALTLSGSSSDYAWLEAVARVLTVAAPIGVGLFALHRPPFERFGLAAPRRRFPVVPLDVGQCRERRALQRRTSLAMGARAAHALLAAGASDRAAPEPDRPGAGRDHGGCRAVPVPADDAARRALSGAGTCRELCRRLSGERLHGQRICAGVHRGSRAPGREFILVAVFVAVAVRLALRVRGSTRVVRRAVTPVLAVACIRWAVFAGGLVGRRLWPEAAVVDVTTWLIALGCR